MPQQAVQYILTFAGATIISIYYAIFAAEISLIYMLLLLMTTANLALTSSTMIVVSEAGGKLGQFLRGYREESDLLIARLVDVLHRPRVALLRTTADVVNALGIAIRNTIHESAEGTHITYLGAVSLQTPNEGTADATPLVSYEDEESQSPHQIYQGALEEATSRKVSIVRFVKLPRVEEIKARSRNVQEDYARWLRRQLSQLNRNENYLLIDSPRAPKWGASGARVICGENIFDITYKNGAAVHIRDPRIATAQAEKIAVGIMAGKAGNITVYSKTPIERQSFGSGVVYEGLQKINKDIEAVSEHLRS